VGDYVLTGVEIGICFAHFSTFAGVSVVGVCVLVLVIYESTHTKYLGTCCEP